jgi:hypothetical protein
MNLYFFEECCPRLVSDQRDYESKSIAGVMFQHSETVYPILIKFSLRGCSFLQELFNHIKRCRWSGDQTTAKANKKQIDLLQIWFSLEFVSV